ncbi:bifunctional methylenetetrahydrofolate dehydrogenase/methenyltetrahydrofolate cyclohydrolase FolD [Lacticaseibacillus pabuli]|uniref:Bifunctional protein FolD n=1 Tax=Lacticaseibacillus pabuli TaxID=3025672 RepID=A0ABY7WV90_9LACO|nr:bifunctional methylenetetrahydrofolate dehydrogenase/methenyltetrahydrofolate cyclohydrolase FolD [Lacticaseibacillus sp. KACC 23028]WDF83378.1 bifunctional methylenetetrahydrofolate dehydrogenase/methenyltetrahydrofolate cyclohydrolase FolD [Lacticaseibacillus sp. KACC 23028]
MTTIMKAKTAIAALEEQLQKDAAQVKATIGREPNLTVLLVGDDPASAIYVRNKQKRAEQLGVDSQTLHLPADTTQAALLAKVHELNADDKVDGILVQLPVPDQIDDDAVINAIDPSKDVDGFTLQTTGRLWTVPKNSQETVGPCTPLGIIKLLDFYGIDIAGKNAVIVGRSNIVGKPMAAMLLNRGATVTIAHSQTENLHEVMRRADILVAATGRRHMVTAADVKPGATVIDVGMNRFIDENGKKRLVGDVDFDAVSKIAGAITPVPGGVGPMTVNLLMAQTIRAAAAKISQ